MHAPAGPPRQKHRKWRRKVEKPADLRRNPVKKRQKVEKPVNPRRKSRKSAPEREKISNSAPKTRQMAPRRKNFVLLCGYFRRVVPTFRLRPGKQPQSPPGGDKKEAAGGTRGFVKYLPKSAF